MSTTSSALDAPIELVDSKPYACQVPACKHPYFGDKGGLDRHKREVHGSTTYCCPVTSCKRNIKGFARKYNLLEHQKRCHPGKLPNTQPALIQRSRNHASLDREGPEGSQCSDGEVSSSEMTIIEGVARTSGGRLREELERLYMRRVKLDSDIATLKRTLDILGESSPWISPRLISFPIQEPSIIPVYRPFGDSKQQLPSVPLSTTRGRISALHASYPYGAQRILHLKSKHVYKSLDRKYSYGLECHHFLLKFRGQYQEETSCQSISH